MSDRDASFLEFDLKLCQGSFQLDVAAQFSRGITAVFGPSGAGKSTLLACLAGMKSPDAGHIVLDGETMFSSDTGVRIAPQSLRTVLVFQDGMLFPHMTVGQNVKYGFQLTQPHHRVIDPDEVCEFLGLTELLDRYPETLSGGERQRVALARGLATSPRLLLLDEPVASLDLRLRNEVVTYLKDIYERYGIPMIYVSHSLSDVMALAPNALALENGRVKSFGPVVDLVGELAISNRVGGDSIDNYFVGTVTDSASIKVGDTELIAQVGNYSPGDRVAASVSASDIVLALEHPKGISARNIIPGVVRRVETGEFTALTIVDVGSGEVGSGVASTEFVVELTPDAVESLELKAGLEVYVVFKTSSITVTAG